MLHGTVSVKEFVDELSEEIDVTLPAISRKQYYDWINTELFHIYSSAVKCIGVNEYRASGNIIDLNSPYVEDDYDFDLDFDPDANNKPEIINCTYETDYITFEDVYKVYGIDNIEFMRSTYGSLVPNGRHFYFKNNGKLCLNHQYGANRYRIMFYMRPKKITAENADDYIIPLPDGFLDVIRAAVRREAFLLSGNISMANAWGQQHSVLFESLKEWYKDKEPEYIR